MGGCQKKMSLSSVQIQVMFTEQKQSVFACVATFFLHLIVSFFQ